MDDLSNSVFRFPDSFRLSHSNPSIALLNPFIETISILRPPVQLSSRLQHPAHPLGYPALNLSDEVFLPNSVMDVLSIQS
ncbi:hypothetical protein F2Q70_00015912 [Brassica cretica]|uniref:Uncharacterized protein n=1 Tax=Brassica cretica TaxID=69181 RepID=A0A8S9HSZ7_BRACR|nr:hypothetical protein F2Q70_00015912 [Brassica cretica]